MSNNKKLRQLFFLPTDLAMELGIIDEKKADGQFLSGTSSVKKLPTNAESQTDGIVLSVKLWNLVVLFSHCNFLGIYQENSSVGVD